MTYTKGKWKTDGELDDIQIFTGNEGNYHRIAKVVGNDHLPPNYEQCQANAERIVKCVNGWDDLYEHNQLLIHNVQGLADSHTFLKAQNEKLLELLKTAHSELTQSKTFSIISLIDMGNISEALNP